MEERQPAAAPSKVAAVYVGIGVLLGFDNLMYAYALLYLPVSTFSLVAATQLGFNAITSRLINAQRFTAPIANSVVVLTFAAALLASDDETSSSSDVAPRGKYALGFVLTLAASASFALILSLFEAAFEKVITASREEEARRARPSAASREEEGVQRGHGTPVGRYPCCCGSSMSALRFATAVNEKQANQIVSGAAR